MSISTPDNKLHILPCFNELLWKKNFGSEQFEPGMDRENIPARPPPPPNRQEKNRSFRI